MEQSRKEGKKVKENDEKKSSNNEGKWGKKREYFPVHGIGPWHYPKPRSLLKYIRQFTRTKHANIRDVWGDSNITSRVLLVGKQILLRLKIKVISACKDSLRFLCNIVRSEKLLHCAAYCPRITRTVQLVIELDNCITVYNTTLLASTRIYTEGTWKFQSDSM
jgi:hypothetical protein